MPLEPVNPFIEDQLAPPPVPTSEARMRRSPLRHAAPVRHSANYKAKTREPKAIELSRDVPPTLTLARVRPYQDPNVKAASAATELSLLKTQTRPRATVKVSRRTSVPANPLRD